MSFQRYQSPSKKSSVPSSAANAAPVAESKAQPAAGASSAYKPQQFSHQPTDTVAHLARDSAMGRFRLDKTVSQTLALEENERIKLETRINDEIEKRWLLSKEKAEVEGYTQGLQEGKAEAYKAELPRIAEKLDRFEQVLQSLDSQKEKIFQTNEAFLISMIGQIAKMITLKEIAIDSEYVKRVTLQLIHQLGNKDDVRVILSEADKLQIDDIKKAVDKEFGILKNTTYESSTDLSAGSCKIETRHGVIDASVEVQIANALKALQN